MGFQTSAYHFYGVHVPKDQWSHAWASHEAELLDRVIAVVKDLAPDVRSITAGDYDDDMLFLSIIRPGVSAVIRLGEFRAVTWSAEGDPSWDEQLHVVVRDMGYARVSPPGWITVPDVS